MKLLFLLLIILAFSNIYSQKRNTTTDKFPVRNGIITTETPLGVLIASSNDSCFASEDGIIISTFYLPGEEAIIIKKENGTFVTYSSLYRTSLSRGDAVSKGTFIGLLKKGNVDFVLRYLVIDEKGKPLTTGGHANYLFQNTSL